MLICSITISAQNDFIEIEAKLDYEKKEIQIQQNIIYYNNSNTSLDTLYFLNWANSYKNNKTPLSKRLIEDYDRSLYFAKKEKRGSSIIKAISSNYEFNKWEIDEGHPDIIRVLLNKSLLPKDSVNISLTYIVKIPDDMFTKYGRNGTYLNLRYWYISPAVYENGWQLMCNLNMDDIYMNPSDYIINFTVPQGVTINTDLNYTLKTAPPYSTYALNGKNRVEVELNINLINDFKEFKSEPVSVITNISEVLINEELKTELLNRELLFIEEHLGKYPHKKIFVSRVTYDKSPIYGLNQLPKMLNPFSDTFEWDIKMFKALTRKYLENTLIINRRNDTWIFDGIQTFLMMKYVEKYYPEIKAIGNISKIWGIRSYGIARLDFNDKYPFLYQFAARTNLDQPLATRADSLSNFNRKIVNKYKAGIGLQYLNEYLNDSIVYKSIRRFYNQNLIKRTSSKNFKEIIEQKTDKDLNWFFNDYINSKKKIDYTISKVEHIEDSVLVTIKNKRNFTVPIAFYGINKDKEILFRKWLTNIDTTTTVKVPIGDIKRLSLNYEYLYPELNLRDNWKNLKGLFNKPLQLRFLKDVEDPYYNQLFYNLIITYNYYDGVLLGPRIYNESLFKKKWLFTLNPTYGTNSKELTGSFSLLYQHLPESSPIYRIRSGITGNMFHYAPELTYKRITPFLSLEFKRKSLRDVGGKAITTRYVVVDRDISPETSSSDSDRYSIFNLNFGYAKPDIIRDLRYSFDFQLGNKFSKLSADFRYRKLNDKNRQYDFRAFFGTFLSNNTEGDYFSFSLDRPNDYLFDYQYLGRSESTGFFSQQIIIAEGGFKSLFENHYANQWMFTTNASVGIWRWIEAYADAGFYKNKFSDPQFKYDSGIRFNFVHNFLEVYFPIQSSLGFEPSLSNYPSRIRFVLTLNPRKIFNFVRRGFF